MQIDVFCVCVCVCLFAIFYVFYHGMHHHFSIFGEFPIKGGMTIPNISSLGHRWWFDCYFILFYPYLGK